MNVVNILDLRADAMHRRKGIHRFLKNDGNLLPAKLVHLLIGNRDEVFAHKQGGTGHLDRFLRQDAQHAHRQRRFARAGFADQAERIALVDGEIHMAHSLHIAGFIEIGDAQITNVKQMFHHFFPPETCLGLSAWFKPSPSM